MSIKNHQEIVVQYLCADPMVFVSEEYLVEWGTAKGKSLWVDAIAIHLTKKVAYLVEVTSDPSARKIIEKLDGFYSSGLPTVRGAMLRHHGLPEDWSIRPWLFVRSEAVPRILGKLPVNVVPKITHLDKTAWEWEYGKIRREGREPGKPYPELEERFQ